MVISSLAAIGALAAVAIRQDMKAAVAGGRAVSVFYLDEALQQCPKTRRDLRKVVLDRIAGCRAQFPLLVRKIF